MTESLPGPNDCWWPAVDVLCRRSWFTRLWVVREIAPARGIEVRCGNQRVPFNLLVDVAKGMLRLGMTDLSYPAWARGLEVGSGVIKLSYLDGARWSGAFDYSPSDDQAETGECVDRIHGILGLVDEGARHDIKVNYENEKSAYWYPYIEFASYVVER